MTLPKPDVLICDVDGTIADMGKGIPGRRGSLRNGAFMWDRVGEDTPVLPIVDVVKALRTEVDRVVFMSGRDEVCRDITRNWLDKQGLLSNGYQLHMRPHKDNRPDDVLKAELYQTHIAPFFNVRWVLDDREKVVKMWRSLGLTVLQVAEGAF